MLKTISKRLSKNRAMICTLMFMLMMLPMATFCTDANVSKVLSGVVNIIFTVARYVGIVLGISGIFQLILAYKDDNADGQSRAVRLVVVALVLIGLKTLVNVTGLMDLL